MEPSLKRKRGYGGNDLDGRRRVAYLVKVEEKIKALIELKTKWEQLHRERTHLTEGARAFVNSAKDALNCYEKHFDGDMARFKAAFPSLAVTSHKKYCTLHCKQ